MSVHDADYVAIKTELGIPFNEPIFVLRAQDRISKETIEHYRMLAKHEGCSTAFVEGIDAEINEFEHWQESNTTKTPD